jgi:hypothetical protein
LEHITKEAPYGVLNTVGGDTKYRIEEEDMKWYGHCFGVNKQALTAPI